MKNILPNYSQIAAMRNRKSQYRLRSAWYGISQPIMNVPRMILMGFTLSMFELAKGLIIFGYSFLYLTLTKPFLVFFAVLLVGILGHLTFIEDPEVEGSNFTPLDGGKS